MESAIRKKISIRKAIVTCYLLFLSTLVGEFSCPVSDYNFIVVCKREIQKYFWFTCTKYRCKAVDTATILNTKFDEGDIS